MYNTGVQFKLIEYKIEPKCAVLQGSHFKPEWLSSMKKNKKMFTMLWMLGIALTGKNSKNIMLNFSRKTKVRFGTTWVSEWWQNLFSKLLFNTKWPPEFWHYCGRHQRSKVKSDSLNTPESLALLFPLHLHSKSKTEKVRIKNCHYCQQMKHKVVYLGRSSIKG